MLQGRPDIFDVKGIAGVRRFLEENEDVRKVYRTDEKIPLSLRADLKACRDILFEEFDASAMRTFPEMMSVFEARFGFEPSSCHNWSAFEDCMSDIPLRDRGGGLMLINSSEHLLRNEKPKIETAIAAFGGISEEWGTPVDNGDWWDRPAIPFAIVLQGPEGPGRQGMKQVQFVA